MDDASAAELNAARLFQFKGEFEGLGVECLSDFNLIQPRDLERMKMNIIHKLRFVAAFRSGGSDACLVADPHSLRDDCALSESASYPSASCQRNPVAAFPVDTASEELDVTRTQLAGSPSGGNDCAIDEEDDEEDSFCGGGSDEDDDMNDVKVIPANKPWGAKRQQKEIQAQVHGFERLKMPRVHDNGRRVARVLDGAMANGGGGGLPLAYVRRACTCAVRRDALKDQLQSVLKTEREIARSRVKSRPYKFARLTRILAYVVFDERGNWLVHASCLQSHLQCSSNFAANVHRVSIALHDAPLEEMSVERVRAPLPLMDYVCNSAYLHL